MIRLRREHLTAIVDHAQETAPAECCGLVGSDEHERSTTIYRLKNLSARPEQSYEAAPEELFAAQRAMRERREQLFAIYHSHPRAVLPAPSETDVRLAYYPYATYLIVGLAGTEPVVKAFKISERERSWIEVEYQLVDE
jgi:proteasome lid subunit RPN8/RPN11